MLTRTDGNEAYGFPAPGGGFSVAFTFLLSGMFNSTSSDGVNWTKPIKIDFRIRYVGK